MSFPKYPTYKPSGVEWLGDVPEHWEVRRLKHIASINMGQSPSSDEYNQDGRGKPFLQGNADFGEISPLPRSYCAVATKFARMGDVLLSVRAPVGAINVADQEYGIGRGLCAITPEVSQNATYLRHSVELSKAELFSIATGSTYQAVTVDQVANVTVFEPPLAEQTVIAAFLDREAAKIDELVAEQRRLIALLKEKRQAVISHAVTKGLNPNAPMKPSGIDWLGEVPEHWDIKKLHYLLKESPKNGTSPEISSDGTIPTFSIAAVRDGGVNISANLKYVSLKEEVARPYFVAKNDVFVLRGSGSKELVGTAGIVSETPPENCIYPDILIRIRPKLSINSWYLVTVLNCPAMRPQIQLAAQTAAGIWKISGSSLDAIFLPVPPTAEQAQIESHLREYFLQVDALTAEAERAIALLQERRTALISAAVTGKIDVRAFSVAGAV